MGWTKSDKNMKEEKKDKLSNYRPQISNNLVFRSIIHFDIDIDKELAKLLTQTG